MTVELHFSGDPKTVRDDMARMLGVGFAVVPVGAAVTQSVRSQAETKAPDAPAAETRAPETETSAPAPKASEKPKGKKKPAEAKPEDDNEARPVSLADIRPALKVLYALAGEKSDKPDDEGKATDSANAVMNLLSEFGVKKVSDLAEEQYADVFAAIKTATAALEG
jgi:hypothetical protein